MSNRYHQTTPNLPGDTLIRESSPGFASGALEVNVVFTDPQATTAALKFAQSIARDLGAHIRLRAAIAVPFQSALEEPPVPVAFLQETLRQLVLQLERDSFEPTVHLYLCRDRVQALSRALRPNSLVVIGARKHWWPTAESRLADALRSSGHRVIFADSRAPSGAEKPVFAR